MMAMLIITRPLKHIATSCAKVAIALGVNMMRRVNRGVLSRSRLDPGPITPTEFIVLPMRMLWFKR